MKLAELVDLLVVQPAGRLVEQQQLRPRREGARELDALLRPVRQPGQPGARATVEAHVDERSSSRRALAVRARARRRGRCRARSSPRKSSTFWNVRAIPRRIDAARRSAEEALAVEADVTSSGVYSRVITLNAVVLPAPFGPIRPTISPASAVERDGVERDDAAELH